MILLGVQFDRSWKIGFKEWLLAVLLGAKVSFCSVYISFLCSHFDRKQSERKKITATDRLLTETVCLAATVFFRTKFICSFWGCFFFPFPPWQYLPELDVYFRCFIAFVSFPWFVIIRAAVENCHWWCVCGFFVSLPCLSPPLWSDTSAPAVRWAEEGEVQMWMCGRWQGPFLLVTSNRLRTSHSICAHY